MAQLKIRLFGSFQVRLAEAHITNFESNKVRALLAYLVVESHEVHSREKLADLFWPDMPANQASSNLSQALYNLRRLIQDHQAYSPYLLRSRDTVQFNPKSDYWLDVNEVKECLDGHRIIDLARLKKVPLDLEILQAAVELYRGDFLEGITFASSLVYDEWMLVQRQRFQRQVLVGLYQLAAYFSERDELTKALSFAWRQVELDPLDERACRQLMQFLAASDQRSQALIQFERLQVLLAEELGIVPEPETLTLRDRIRGAELGTSQKLNTGDNLPAFLVPLIGRQEELAELRSLISNPDCRLLTMLGPGGSGKTRLAQEVARSSMETFKHGICFVSLNPIQSPVSILPAIVDALDLPRGEQDDHQVQLGNYLRNKNLLLVLDGFEYLLEGAGLIAEILHQIPGLKILVTSRTRLNIKGEHLYYLAGMRFPAENAPQAEILGSDAVQLLLNSLQRTRGEYEPGSEEVESLLQICRKVQGMPLGILLAASWGATLSVAEINAEVNQGLDFLTTDWFDVPARQRSMRATFDHTWNLLGEHEQSIFQSLSVFRGAFTRKASRAVSGATPYELRNLIDRSLLWSKTPGWYEVHELLRQYGREKLAQTYQVEKLVCDQHCEYYLRQLARLGEDLKTTRQVAALSSIDIELENYSAAWNWALSQGMVAQLSLATDALCLYYSFRMRYQEGIDICHRTTKQLAELPPNSDTFPIIALLKIWESNFTRLSGDYQKAQRLLIEVQIMVEKRCVNSDEIQRIQAHFYRERGNCEFARNLDTAYQDYFKSSSLLQTLNEPWWLAKVMSGLTINCIQRGAFLEAKEYFRPTLAFFQNDGDPVSFADVLKNKSYYHVRIGELDEALELMVEANEIYKSIGEPTKIAEGLSSLGTIYGWHGAYEEGINLLTQSLAIYQDLYAYSSITYLHSVLGILKMHLGQYAIAKKHYRTSLSLARSNSFRRLLAGSLLGLGWLALVNADFRKAKENLLESVSEYKKVNHQEELSWALSALGHAMIEAGEAASGWLCLWDAIETGKQVGAPNSLGHCLAYTAFQRVKQGCLEEAVEFYTLACQHPSIGNSRWFEDIAGREISAAAESLPSELVTAAQARGRKRDIWETAGELLMEFQEKV